MPKQTDTKGVNKKFDINTTTEAPYLFRLNGGNDATETLRVLQKSGHFFLVKRNLRRAPPSIGWM
jgi:hypothetical protein